MKNLLLLALVVTSGTLCRAAGTQTDSFVLSKRMAEAKVPVTINLIMTADVTEDHPIINPQCMAVMAEVRKAIRGK